MENPTHGSVWMVQIQPTSDAFSETVNPTHGSVWMVQIPPTRSEILRSEESHTRKCVDGSDPAFIRRPLRNRQSHTRKCVDGSDPAYQKRHPPPKSRIPHTEVCGWFRSSLASPNTRALFSVHV